VRDWCQKQEGDEREKIQKEVRIRCQQVTRMCIRRTGRRNPEPRKTKQQKIDQIVKDEVRAT
jgi:hypothetical protein